MEAYKLGVYPFEWSYIAVGCNTAFDNVVVKAPSRHNR